MRFVWVWYDGYCCWAPDQGVEAGSDCSFVEAVELFRDAVAGFLEAFETQSIWSRGFRWRLVQDCFGNFVIGEVLAEDSVSSRRGGGCEVYGWWGEGMRMF